MNRPLQSEAPAFPVNEKHGDGTHYFSFTGMTLRDYFAAAALPALLASEEMPVTNATKYADATARAAYCMADAMIAERAK